MDVRRTSKVRVDADTNGTSMDRTWILQLYRRMLRPQIVSKEFLQAAGLRLQDRLASKKKQRFPRQKVAEAIAGAVRDGFRSGRSVENTEAQSKLLQGALNTYVLLQKAAYADGLERALVQNAIQVHKDLKRAARRPARKKVRQARESCKETVELMWNAPWQQLCNKHGLLAGNFFAAARQE